MRLRSLAWLFLKTGSMAFGGWSTTAVLLRKELVENRQLINEKQLGTAIASGQVLPGAAQVIIVVQTAYHLRRVKGAVIGTAAYLMPSVLLTLGFSFIYFNHLHDSDFTTKTVGLQAAVGGIILGNAYRIGKPQITRPVLWLGIILACIAYLVFNIQTAVIIMGFGIIGLLLSAYKRRRQA